MFILRKITKKQEDSGQINIDLGSRYTLTNKINHPTKFKSIMKDIFDNLNEDITYAFISTEDGSDIYPLYTTQHNYIMTESGKTFTKVQE